MPALKEMLFFANLNDVKRSAAFGGIMFASSAMNNIFVTYYLDLFMNIVEVTPFWFFVGQCIFMVWNALNDPLFGWISDTFQSDNFLPTSGSSRRIKIIKFGGFIWTIAFLLVWFPPDTIYDAAWLNGIHFTVSLCFYDGMLTLVEVNHSALLVEITSSSKERAKFNAYAAVFAGFGSLSSLFGHSTWDRNGLTSFRVVCLLVALLSSGIFVLSCDTLSPKHRSDVPSEKKQTVVNCGSCGPGNTANGTVKEEESLNDDGGTSIFKFLTQITKHHNLCVFMLIYFIQGFDCTFEKNHFGIFLDGLVGDAYSRSFLGGIITASFILPWIGTVLITPLIQKHGIYFVLKSIFYSRVAFCSVSMLFSSSFGPLFTCGFLLINRIMSESVCRLCPLVISDIVDEDSFLHQRKKPMSATIIGTSTLLGKGSQSIAPMLGYTLFSQQFRSTDQSGETLHSTRSEKELMSKTLVLLPLLCVIMQSILWSFYFNLHGKYLKKVKNSVSKAGFIDSV